VDRVRDRAVAAEPIARLRYARFRRLVEREKGVATIVSQRHTDALKRRWADPAYRAKQTAHNQRMADALRAAFAADPSRRALHGRAIAIGKRRKRKERV